MMNKEEFDADVVGYQVHNRGRKGQETYKRLRQPPGFIYTQAFILCCECGGVVSGHGGPNPNAICLTCYEKVKENGN